VWEGVAAEVDRPSGSLDGRGLIGLERWEACLPALRAEYQSAEPFPHIVLDDFLPAQVARATMASFPARTDGDWISYVHVNERKFGNNRPATWPPILQGVLGELHSERFVGFLHALTGIDELFPDDSLEGGGLHLSEAGGFLNIHADFTVHPKERSWQRRVNFLLYLNADWQADYGGDLELWVSDMSCCARRIAARGNRVVIFNTGEDSFHGHPNPLSCPAEVTRQSLALYYFTEEIDPLVRSTEYRARPGDGIRAGLIFLDKEVLRAYDWAKRRLGLSDELASSTLARIDRLRRRSR
jgi:hypothetical protein